jgi:hypothetical protein
MSELELDISSEQGSWRTKEGKSIPYTRERCQLLIDDDWNDYYLQITKWPKNTTIEIAVVSGHPGYDAESRWSNEQIYRLVKLPHRDFVKRQTELIQDAIDFANNLLICLATHNLISAIIWSLQF